MPNNIKEKPVLLVGAGSMAIEYLKVLQHLNIPVTVVGRGHQSAKIFEDKTGVEPVIGGISNFLNTRTVSEYGSCIITTGTEVLSETCRHLIKYGVKNMLIEKPGGRTIGEVISLSQIAVENDVNLYIAYNRRFYSSVLNAIDIIMLDKGVKSFNFEFTEWAHIWEKIEKPEGVKENTFFNNSTHVVDMAFFLGGFPKVLNSYSDGQLDWHPKAIFTGSGVSNEGALFSYHSNWNGPGRWGLEVITTNNRLIFRPLEKLQIQKLGSIEINYLEIDDEMDTKFKPGLFWQTYTFLNPESKYRSYLIDVKEQAYNAKSYYTTMLEGGIFKKN